VRIAVYRQTVTTNAAATIQARTASRRLAAVSITSTNSSAVTGSAARRRS
jgi:hypothetical protein